jgi:hypothetical protein
MMVRTEQCVPVLVMVVGVGVLAACGQDDPPAADPAPNPATSIALPTAAATPAAAAGWTMPTGVFRKGDRAAGLLELHVAPGRFLLYDVGDGTPDLGYAADCVPDDPSRVTCTGPDGFRIVFAWSGTDDVLQLTLPGGERNDQEVFEGAQWTRVS